MCACCHVSRVGHKNTGLGYHYLLQGTFPTQGWNSHLLCLLRWQSGSLPLAPPGNSFAKLVLKDIYPMLLGNPSLPETSVTTVSLLSRAVQSLSCVPLFVTLWTAAHQASLSITNSQSLLKLMSIELVMSSNHLILCRPLLLLSRWSLFILLGLFFPSFLSIAI